MLARDQELLNRWASGRDAAAFSELVTHYAGMVYSINRRILGDEEAARDASQECFLKLARLAPKLKTSLGGWLHRVSTRAALNAAKKERTRRQYETRYSESSPVAEESRWQDIEELVDEAIDQLPEKYRYALVSHFFEERTHEAIGKDLRVSRQAVAYRIKRGVANLRAYLAERGALLGVALLGELLQSNLVEAAPSGLKVSLSKIALSGVPTRASVNPAKLVVAGFSVAAIAIVLALVLGMPLSGAPVASSEPSLEVQAASERDGAAAPINDVEDPENQTTEKSIAELDGAPDVPVVSEEADGTYISGTVVDENGRGIVGATITAIATGYFRSEQDVGSERPFIIDAAFRNDYLDGTYMDRSHHFVGRTDAIGNFSFNIPLSGGVVVFATKEGYNTVLESVLAEKGEAVDPIALTLLEGTTFLGKVVDADGRPVTDAVVRSAFDQRPNEDHPLIPGYHVTNILNIAHRDSRGMFTIGFDNQVAAAFEINSKTHGTLTFETMPIEEGVVSLFEMVGPSSMSGAIRRSGGASTENLMIEISGRLALSIGGRGAPVQRQVLRGGDYMTSKQAITLGAQGEYAFWGIDYGRVYEVNLYDAKGETLAMDLEIPDFAPAEERVWNYEIEDPIAVAGHVYDEETGKALTGLRVYARKSTDNLYDGMKVDALVNSDGAYELKLMRGPGEYHVFPAYSPHFKQGQTQPSSAIIQVKAGQTVEVNLMYHSAFTRAFRVVDEAGNPIRALTQIHDGRIGTRRGAQAEKDGEFIYAGFPTGVETWVAFAFRARKFASTESSHYIGEPGEVVDVETIILKSDSTIQGTVIDPSGAPYVGEGTLILRHQDGEPKYERILPDAEGLIVLREPGLRYEYGAEETVFTVEFATRADFGDGEQSYLWRSEAIACMPGYDVDLGTMQLSLREADPVTPPES